MFLLKLTIPLVDYEVENHNWNKITTTVNCLVSPTFMVFAVKGTNLNSYTKFKFNSIKIWVFKVGNKYLFNTIPIWSIALVLGVALALFVWFTTDLNSIPKYHWVNL